MNLKILELENMIYKEFSKKSKQLEKIKNDKYKEKEKEQDYERVL